MDTPVSGSLSQPHHRYGASIREALRGSHQDFTIGSFKPRHRFCWPFPWSWKWLGIVVRGGGRILGRAPRGDAVATVGLTESMLGAEDLRGGIRFELSTTAMVARRIGEKDTTVRPSQVCRLFL